MNKYYFNKICIDIIFEDNHLLVIKKPINILSQKDETNDISLCEILKAYLKEKYQKPGNVYLGVVHRLDRPVSGVMVFTKTSKAAGRISEQIRNGSFKKNYLAVLDGTIDIKSGTLKDYLYKDRSKNIVVCVPENFDGAKEAILNYRVIEHNDKMTLVDIELITGRSHQIRIQFANIGNPIIGDKKYGKSSNRNGTLSLWSTAIKLLHPISKEEMKFELYPGNDYPWNTFRRNFK